MKWTISLLTTFLCSSFVQADINSHLNVATIDGTTCNTYPYKIIFPNANCTDNADGTVSISITAGGGSSLPTTVAYTTSTVAFTQPQTITSSLTVTGNAGIQGQINQPLTVASSVTVTAGNAVQIASNTILSGTTFYQGGNVVIGALTASRCVQTDANNQVSSTAGACIASSINTLPVSVAYTTSTVAFTQPQTITSSLTVLGNFGAQGLVNQSMTHSSSVTFQGVIGVPSNVNTQLTLNSSGTVLGNFGVQGLVNQSMTHSSSVTFQGVVGIPSNVNTQLTANSSMTVLGNFGVQGQINQPTTFTSSPTFQGVVGIPSNINTQLTMNSSGTVLGNFGVRGQINQAVTVASSFTLTNAGTPAFGIQTTGHVVSSGTIPTVNTCGTLPTVRVGSTDFAGIINTGSASPTACTLAFANTFTTVPVCVISDNLQTATPEITAISATGFTATMSAALNSGQIFYICVGNQ